MLRVKGVGFRVPGSRFVGVKGLGFRVRVQGLRALGFRV